MSPGAASARVAAALVVGVLAVSTLSTLSTSESAAASTPTTARAPTAPSSLTVLSSLPPLRALRPLTRLDSPNRRYSAELRRGNGALVVLGSRSQVMWSNGVRSSKGSPRLVLERSGDLVEYAHPGGPLVWSSGSKSVRGGLRLVMENNGDLVVSSSLSPAWSSTSGAMSQAVTVVAFGDSEGAETDQFLGGALNDAAGVPTTFVAHDYPGTAVCDWIENGTMATATNADVVALFFTGDGLSPCTDPSADLSAMALDNLTVADMAAAINLLLTGTVEHVLVISPIPRPPSTVPPAYLATQLKKMVESLHNPRVTYVGSPSLSVSPTGAVPTTMPCTGLEIAGGVCQGPVVNGVRTNLVFATNGHFCITSLTSDAPAVGTSLAPCPGFQPGAWRWANAEATSIFSLYGLPFTASLRSGYAA